MNPRRRFVDRVWAHAAALEEKRTRFTMSVRRAEREYEDLYARHLMAMRDWPFQADQPPTQPDILPDILAGQIRTHVERQFLNNHA